MNPTDLTNRLENKTVEAFQAIDDTNYNGHQEFQAIGLVLIALLAIVAICLLVRKER